MKNTKRIIAAVLAAIMMISMLPSNVFATETEADAAESAVEAVSVPGEEQEIESTMEAVSEETSETVQESSEVVQTVENAEPAAAEETEQTAEVPEEETVLYPEQDFEGKTDHVTVKVHAPEGALPEGTELKVEEIKKAEVEDLVSEATEDMASDFVAVDVSFHVDGQEEDFAPLKEVEVEFALEKDVLPEAESYDVIHVAVDEKGKETPEVIEEEKIIDEITAEGGTISQKDFSVFIIAAKDTSSAADTEDPKPTYAVETWYFYTSEDATEPNDEWTQAVKAGDDLLEPPTIEVEDGQVFTGWYEKANGVYAANPVSFGPVASVGSSRTEHHVYPVVEDKVYVVFYDYDNDTILETRAVASGSAVDITDVKAQSTDTDNVFAGWAYTADADLTKVITTTTINPDEDKELYPVYTTGYRLSFNLNDEDGGGTTASYVEPQYLTATDTTVRPENPSRSGFDFVDWYTDETLETPFAFGGTISQDTTVYAKWDGGDSSYTVIVWQQKVTDDKAASDEEKAYDFVEASPETIPAKTGTKVNAPSEYLSKDYPGFVLNENNTDHDVVVKADGSTVVNVKYDRQLITWKFKGGIYRYAVGDEDATHYYYRDNYPSGYYFGGTGPEASTHQHRSFPLAGYYNCEYIWTPIYLLFIGGPGFVRRGDSGYYYYRYTNQTGYHEEGTDPDPNAPATHVYVEDGIMTGLYGQDLAQYGYIWPYGKWSYPNTSGSVTTLTFTETFMWLDTPNPTNVNFNTTNETVAYTIYNYIEGTDGEFYMADEAYGYGSADSSVTFTFDKKYDGYTPTGYVLGTYISGNGDVDDGEGGSSATPSEIVKIKEKDKTSFVPSQNENQLHIFHSRVESTITFQKTDGTTIKTTDPIKYLADISGYANETADAPENYEFTGWYTDATCYNQYDFNGKTMPANNLVVYAGFKLVSHDVTIDPNGGVFDDGTSESRTIKVTHSEVVPGEELSGISREDYILSGWTIGTEGGTTWANTDVVMNDITLVANWTYTGSIVVEYYYNGELVAEGGHPYRDGAKTEITHVAPETEDYFKAWSENEDGSGTLYYPGQLYLVDASKAEDGVIKLYAVCSQFELPTTNIKFYPNQEGATIKDTAAHTAAGDEYIEWADLNVNRDEIDLSEITGEHRTMKLVGWAKTKDGTKVFDVDDVVAADETGNALYGVWEVGTFKIHHSSKDGQTDCCETFKMPANGHFNIAAHTAKGFLYGGYYEYTNDVKGSAYTENGLNMTPVQDTTYYLKEVDEKYLVPQVYVVWSKYQSSRLRSLHIMTAVDDDSYDSQGIMITGGASENAVLGLSSVLTINTQGELEDFNSEDIFKVPGYLGIDDASKYVKSEDYKGKDLVLTAYFVTPDKIKVSGVVQKTLNLGNLSNLGWTAPGITMTEKSVNSSLDVKKGVISPGRPGYTEKYEIAVSPEVISYTVTKNDDGSKYHQTMEPGDNSGRITFAGKDGYVFAGWYKDAEYKEAADFTDVRSDMTVYAKYVKASNVKLSFRKKAAGSGAVTLTATLKITGVSGLTDAGVNCTFNDNDYAVEIGTEKETKSGSSIVKTYTGVVTINGLANKTEFKAVISYTTSDGTVVNLDAKTCKYASGYVTVK